MSTLYEKSLVTLELPKVLELLASCATCDEAREKALALRPMTDVDEIRYKLQEVSAACKLISYKTSPNFQAVKDVSGSLKRADMGGSLNTRELLAIADVLRTARIVKTYADGQIKTCIDHLFDSLRANKFLEERITNSIIGDDELADSASTELADIRRHMKVANSRAREALNRIITSPAYSKYLREPIITLRGDRYVVPVRSEYKNEIPGLVHDVSSSGGTFFVEPMQVVNANNELRELLAKEKKEIERILAELSAMAAEHMEDILDDYSTLVYLDLIFAKAKLSYNLKCIEPIVEDTRSLELRHARHPLINIKSAVPIDVRLGKDFDTLVVTGPNTGGKTVTLKTIGLLTLMAECGLHIPADDGSTISVFDKVLADIGDEQSIEQSLSTFSSHMKNIVEIIDEADMGTMILFDELGAGTDPVEGAALAIAIIENCRQMGARIAATTHYAELKVYAMRTEGVQNASCEFDVETLKPTYRLLIGIPGKSNAFAISRRLGLSEYIIKKAGDQIDKNDADFEDVITQLETQRQAMEAAKLEAEKLRKETEESKNAAEKYREEIKREREKAVQKARAEAQSIIDDARSTANAVIAELKDMRKQLKHAEDFQGMNDKQSSLRRELNEAEARLGEKKEKENLPPPSRDIVVGDTVELLNIGSKATVLAIEKDGSYRLQAGILNIKAKKDEVRLIENQQQDVKKFIEKSKESLRSLAATPELDIRGMLPEEAEGVVNLFIDNAVLGNLPSVRIIHGKGTGVLRKAVQTQLKRDKRIKSYRNGLYGEGEDGVTIAELK